MPHGHTAGGEALPRLPPRELLATLSVTELPVSVDSVISCIPIDQLGKAIAHGEVRAYFLPDSLSAGGRPVGLKVSFGIGSRQIFLPQGAPEGLHHLPHSTAGGSVREYQLSRTDLYRQLRQKGLCPTVHGLAVLVFQEVPACHAFGLQTNPVPTGVYTLEKFASAYFGVPE